MHHQEHSDHFSSEESENIDLEESDENMNENQQALFLNITKSRSNDSFLGKLIGPSAEIQKRPLVLNLSQFCPTKSQSQNNQNVSTLQQAPISIFKKVKKQKKHNKCDYQKNICGYITKKIIRQFIGPAFQQYVNSLCKKYYCDSEQARKFYLSKIEFVTGPSHIPALLQPQKQDSRQTIFCKFAFRQFFDWFLRNRYVRYLMLQGKMTDKKAYIEYKNNILFNFIQQDRVYIEGLKQKLLNQKKQQLKIQDEFIRIRSFSSNSRRSKSNSNKNIILTQRLQ